MTAESIKTPMRIDYSRLRVLIVDDFENFRLSMRQMLRSMGIGHIDACANGATAIQSCTYEQFDIVLCDFNLGKNKNGQHILEELRHRKLLRRTSLFVMVTAETSKEMVMGAREYQPDGYLTKPINQASLNQRLNAMLQQRAILLPINREIDLENLPKAISLCSRMLPQQPRYRTWILKTLSDLYFQLGDYSHARRICEDVLQSRDISWAQIGLGRILLAEQRAQEAVEVLQTLLKKQPDVVEGYDLMAKAQAALGNPGSAQKTLERACRLSPNAIRRQQQLAAYATENQDMETASSAWRYTVQLGLHSIHDHPDHYLGLGRTLSDLCENDKTDDGQAQAQEALLILKTVHRRFPDAGEAHRQAKLVEARVHQGQDRYAEAEECLSTVLSGAAEVGPDTELELARTLFALGRADEARTRLLALSQRHESNQTLQSAIEALLDEPVSLRQRISARRLTRQGIHAFEDNDLEGASATFEEALVLVPDHAALNLNLVQVRLRQLEDNPGATAYKEQCRRCLDALVNLPPRHPQYRRFQALKRKVEALL